MGRFPDSSFQGLERRSGLRIRAGRCDHLQDARRRDLSKAGLEAAAIGRSRGGLTTKTHTAVDALGLPIRFLITPGHWGDRPQARELIAGLNGVGQVIMGSGHDADHVRRFIIDELDAVPQIKQNRSRSERQAIDWTLYTEHHFVECFFN